MSPEEAYAAAVDASGAGVSAIFVTGDPAQMLRAALASLRVSGYVVVPVEPTEARLYEIGGEISRMIEPILNLFCVRTGKDVCRMCLILPFADWIGPAMVWLKFVKSPEDRIFMDFSFIFS